MTKEKTGIVKTSFKACLKGDVYPQSFMAGQEISGEALKIGMVLKSMGGTKDQHANYNAANLSEADVAATAKAEAEADAKAEAEAKAEADAKAAKS